jgi:hypothetical protein
MVPGCDCGSECSSGDPDPCGPCCGPGINLCGGRTAGCHEGWWEYVDCDPCGHDADADADAPDGGDADADADVSCSFSFGREVIPQPTGPVPAPGVPFVVPQTGITVTRISDVGDPGITEPGLTNGYSRWSPANRTGEYVIAFGIEGTSFVYRLSDRTMIRALDLGESNELHWDQSDAPGTETTLYYRVGTSLLRMDVLTGSETPVHDFAVEYPGAFEAINAVEGAPSRDMRLWAFMICDGDAGGCETLRDIVAYDMSTDTIVGRLREHESTLSAPNYVDVSPSGSRIVVATCAGEPGNFDGPHAWSTDFSSAVKIGNDCTHAGWAWGYGGEEYFVSQDNGAGGSETADYMIAVDVNAADGWTDRVSVLYHGDIGWGSGMHFGRLYDPAVRGWMFMSTYSDSTEASWGYNQLFFVELLPETSAPRIWRVVPTMNAYDGYFSEAFASLDAESQNVWWGGNWNGADNLELYRARLCNRWWETLGTP